MNTQEVADKLVNLCKAGEWKEALDTLYSDDAVSIEMPGVMHFPERVEGMDAIRAKGAQWEAAVEEVHGMEIEGPLVAGDHFTCTMVSDVTMKGMGRRKNAEICLYRVKEGKIVSEQFFYPTK